MRVTRHRPPSGSAGEDPRSPRDVAAALAPLAPLIPLVIGVALWAAVHLGDALVPPGPGEAWMGRWLRKLAEHPLRGSLSLGLLLLAAGVPRGLGGGASGGLEGPPGPLEGPRAARKVESGADSG